MSAIPTPEEARASLELAAGAPHAETRTAQLDGLRRSYQKLYAALERRQQPGSAAPAPVAPSQFASGLANELARNDNPAERAAAAMRFAGAYAEAFRKYAETAEDTTTYGGRSGNIAFVAEASLDDPNERLVELIDLEFPRRRIAPPAVYVPLDGGCDSPPDGGACPPSGYRVNVQKPEGTATARAAGFDPAFVQYLQRTGQSHLLTLESWSDQTGPDLDSRSAEAAYAAALASAWQAYEEELFQGRYCRPGDLPSPNIYRGYRLLRLDTQLCEEHFRPQSACPPSPAIYEGPLGPATPPEIDYEELIRRYVRQLRQDVAPASRPVSPDEIVRVIAASGLHPNQIALFAQATRLALDLHGLSYWEEIRSRFPAPSAPASSSTTFTAVARATSLPASRFAFRPQSGGATSPAEWLFGPEGQEVRTAVERLWQSQLPEPPPVAPAATIDARVPEGSMPVAEFRKHLESLTGTSTQTPGNADPLGYYPSIPGGGRDPNSDTRVKAKGDALIGKIASLADGYSGVWTAARSVLGDQGMRERMVADPRIEFGPQEFEAYLFHVASYATANNSKLVYGYQYGMVTADESKKIAESVPVAYDDIARYIASASMEALVDRLEESYANALDVLLTLTDQEAATAAAPAGTSAQTLVSGGGQLTRADIPNLMHIWGHLFWSVIERLLAARLPLGDNFIVLRLTKRSGRFGEVPRRPQSGEIEPEPKDIPWPGHPSIRTEAWMLEPIPRRYYMAHHPGIYVQEFYSVSLRSRGFGIGRNLYSMSLLPEEEQTIVVKSFKDTTLTVTESTAENIFEEGSSETEQDFGEEVMRETERESTSEEAGHVGAKVSGGFPVFFSANIDASYDAKGASRDFAKDVRNVTQKLATKLSAKRGVTVETKRSTEQKVELHAELNTERTIKNPNMGHTVTFHWFQMTRKYLQQIELEDARLLYTSGKYNLARISVPRGASVPAGLKDIPGYDRCHKDELVAELPADVAALLPPGVAVVIMTEPYREVISMAGANAFLAKAFTPQKAAEVGSTVWRLLGESESAPDGLGVLAFSAPRGEPRNHDDFVELFDERPDVPQSQWAPELVAADKIEIAPKWDLENGEVLYLPNLDLRYKARDGQAPSRYDASPYDVKSLPRLLNAEERIVNTNGVFCDAMVGQCTALEDYLQRHRELDLLEKKVQVGQQELEFRWELAKDGMEPVLQAKDEPLVAVVSEMAGEEPFKARIEVEKAQLEQQKSIAEDQLERQRLETELEMLRKKVDQLEARVGVPPEIKIDAPEGSSVAVEAKVNIDSADDDGDGGTLTID